MSQVSIIDIEGNHPQIPTQFDANVGFAIPIANVLEILGEAVAAGSTPVQTVGSGNTITTQVQISQAIASTNASKIGLSAFDSSAFGVDANGFVTLLGGGGAATNIDVDTSTPPGTDPVVPNMGNITMTGAQVSSGTVGANVLRSASLAANTVTYQIQQSGSAAAQNTALNGVSHFNSSHFTVANGFVSLAGAGQAIDSIGTQTGTNPINPTSAGLVTINGAVVAAGTNPVRSNGTGASTMALEVQISQAIAATDATKIGLCNFNSSHFSVDANGFVSLVGGGKAIDSFTTDLSGPVSPDVAGNIAFTGATNIFSDGSVASTMRLNLQGTNHALFVGRGSNTASASLATGSTGQILQSAGASADPAFSTATYPSTATGTGSILRADGTNWSATTATYPNSTTINQILYSSAANTVSGITTANNSIVLTNGSGVPSLGTSLSNDFTFTSSTAGSTRTLTISNTDNTNTASAALVKVSTGGASSGDAQFQASTTATNWTFGIDNSDSDVFAVSQGTALGTNNVIKASTSGEINYPLQPAFLAYNSASDTNQTGDGTAATVIFDTEVTDQNSDYNNTTGVFTAPVTGFYHFCASVSISNIAAGHTSGRIQLVGTSRTIWGLRQNPAAVASSGITSYVISTYLDMTAGDTAQIQIVVNGSTKTITINGGSTETNFSGKLVA